MTTRTDADSAVTAYLDAVRLSLADLPEWDREELMSDIEEHVREVAAEWDGPLHSILGDPISFVDTYRSSADIPLREPSIEPAPLLDQIVRSVEALRRSDAARSFRAYISEARPGWWAVRGYLGATTFLYTVAGDPHPVLSPWAHGVLGLLIIAVGTWLSIHLGRRSQGRTWRRRVAIAFNVVVLAATLGIGAQLDDVPIDSYADDAGDAWQAGYESGIAEVAQPISAAPLVIDNATAVGGTPTTTAPADESTIVWDEATVAAVQRFDLCMIESGMEASVVSVDASAVVVAVTDSNAGPVNTAVANCYQDSGLGTLNP